jgi:hypothetical protein
MSDSSEAQAFDAQRRALFACEVIVNRRLHDFSTRYRSQYSNDVAAERKAIEKAIARIRRRIPAPPLVDDLAGAVATAAGLDEETARRVLLALADLRPDVLAREAAADAEDDDEDED